MPIKTIDGQNVFVCVCGEYWFELVDDIFICKCGRKYGKFMDKKDTVSLSGYNADEVKSN